MSSRQQVSDAAVDDKQLKAALDHLAGELAVPFVERRLSGASAKKKAVGEPHSDQLEDAVQELTARERELSAAIGIANMLLTKNRELAEDCRAAQAENAELEATVAMLRQESSVLGVTPTQESLVESECRLKRLEEELDATEGKLHEERLTSHRLAEELSAISTHPDAVSLLEASHQDTIEELRSTHAAELRTLAKSLQSLEKEHSALQRKGQESEFVLARKTESVSKLEEDLAKVTAKLGKEREENLCLARRCSQAEDRAKYLELDLNMALRRGEKLEEEVKLLSSTPTPSTSEIKHERHTSLFSKLHGIEENEEIEAISDVEEGTNSGFAQTSWRREMSLDLGNESADEDVFRRDFFAPALTLGGRNRTPRPFGFDDSLRISVLEGVDILAQKRQAGICCCESVSVPGKKGAKRKDPSEEYFLLVSATQATQAVKFSSPYMDSVCTVSAKSLYQQALQEGIAFHKWHTWIEDQLTRAYVKNLYSSDHRS